jgi:hypothetical protein
MDIDAIDQQGIIGTFRDGLIAKERENNRYSESPTPAHIPA